MAKPAKDHDQAMRSNGDSQSPLAAQDPMEGVGSGTRNFLTNPRRRIARDDKVLVELFLKFLFGVLGDGVTRRVLVD